MIAMEDRVCQETGKTVQALVETRNPGKPSEVKEPLSCTQMAACAKTTFCRFVNPLTTRNPLQGEVVCS